MTERKPTGTVYYRILWSDEVGVTHEQCATHWAVADRIADTIAAITSTREVWIEESKVVRRISREAA